eukprot:6210564-Pleurochrysis_carterae.AAC.1
MSYTVSALTLAAVIASISTPVPPAQLAVEKITTALVSGFNSKSTLTCERRSGWQSGMSSEVRFAASMPATRETASTSPLVVWPCARARTVAVAVAERGVDGLCETLTIDALPDSSMVAAAARREGCSRVRAAQSLWLARLKRCRAEQTSKDRREGSENRHLRAKSRARARVKAGVELKAGVESRARARVNARAGRACTWPWPQRVQMES